MDKTLYSEKEMASFNGLMNLMKKGANPYSIKVSDIAKAANIGKGTIYDYFGSKEEAISEAILYSLTNEIESGYSRIKSKDSFKEKFYETLYTVSESVENNVSTFNMLLSVGGVQEFYEYLLDDRYDLSKCVSRVENVIEHLLEAGVREGVIDTKESRYYQIMVVNSSIMGFAQYVSRKSLYPDTSIEEAMEAAYKLVVKALN